MKDKYWCYLYIALVIVELPALAAALIYWCYLYIALVIFGIILTIVVICAKIYAVVVYGDTPVKDCPVWVGYILYPK